ncbi:CRISPR-associated helicase Cas3' [Nonomuraea endophytica]|uniref:CRISPR-associated helicase Cas3/CRISPR-associated endonuclease Cas3-HD n=1 Tax=Nonomuraea endophytica TaxID=714136 RepID=A0A7W8AF69_9ACTN|nr:CRISPR-associated helicase Cas3' [Nonomuraea endophytica]MBB5085072.1 CRISPR-associated helicase Cas3/CRISPR-associated endonuclease Cas3-HD [Nonomuraea endophytica]
MTFMRDGGSLWDRLSLDWSSAAHAVWAKHDRPTDGWLPLWSHMADSGSVATRLWDIWLPPQVRRIIAGPLSVEEARRLAIWLATIHDIGKATPAFACQVDPLAEVMRQAGLTMPEFKLMPDRKLAPHGLAGQVLLQEWLMERFGWTRSAAHQLTIVVGGHHGVPPAATDIHEVATHAALLRTPDSATSWKQVQWEFLDRCAQACDVLQLLGTLRAVKLPQPSQVLLTGLVIVADWIASNPDLFPYFPEAAGRTGSERVEAAWRGLDLPQPWKPVDTKETDVDTLFATRFRLPVGAEIRPVQRRAVELARSMTSPGLMIIEAPMGEGKTEAALAVAEVFAARSGAGGCFVALPTMATGNAMFTRVLQWLDRALGVDQRHSVQLAHSKAALNKHYAALVRAGRRAVHGVDIDGDDALPRKAAPAELIAHQWLRGRKKGMLASFVVGTVDQLLFMGLKSRHLALRHLALAGKVVIIDEAHAYDEYMNSYLDRVLTWLGAYGVPVVVLSATLPATRRRDLATAYAGTPTADAAEDGYPLLTAVEPAGQPVTIRAEPSNRSTTVQLEPLEDDLDALSDRLAADLAQGGCALVVRNTVDRVLETAAHLRSRFGADAVTVAHARFVDVDRLRKDAELLERFGPPQEASRRPTEAHIVVASQVAEQSLDIDFDLLVSDLCPIDLLLQRIGRLHRHERGERPPRVDEARCLVTGADWQAVPVPVRGSRRVYRSYALLRSAAALHPHLFPESGARQPVELPADISPLVQRAYGSEPIGPQPWQQAIEEARLQEEAHQQEQRRKASAFQLGDIGKEGRALFGWLEAGVGDAEDTPRGRAQVRDGIDALEVLVVQKRRDGTLATLPHLGQGYGGRVIPTDSLPEPQLARVVASCALRLPYHFSMPHVIDRAISELEKTYIPAWQTQDSSWLAGQLILELDENCRTRLAGYDLRYTPADGLEVSHAG